MKYEWAKYFNIALSYLLWALSYTAIAFPKAQAIYFENTLNAVIAFLYKYVACLCTLDSKEIVLFWFLLQMGVCLSLLALNEAANCMNFVASCEKTIDL